MQKPLAQEEPAMRAIIRQLFVLLTCCLTFACINSNYPMPTHSGGTLFLKDYFLPADESDSGIMVMQIPVVRDGELVPDNPAKEANKYVGKRLAGH
jgi:hypothetical protein